jgi:hypothetical protein
MALITLTPIALNDRVRMRKAHPCGSLEWTIVRLGADIGLKCAQCGRRVLLSRRDFERRLERVLVQQDDTAADSGKSEEAAQT